MIDPLGALRNYVLCNVYCYQIARLRLQGCLGHPTLMLFNNYRNSTVGIYHENDTCYTTMYTSNKQSQAVFYRRDTARSIKKWDVLGDDLQHKWSNNNKIIMEQTKELITPYVSCELAPTPSRARQRRAWFSSQFLFFYSSKSPSVRFPLNEPCTSPKDSDPIPLLDSDFFYSQGLFSY